MVASHLGAMVASHLTASRLTTQVMVASLKAMVASRLGGNNWECYGGKSSKGHGGKSFYGQSSDYSGDGGNYGGKSSGPMVASLKAMVACKAMVALPDSGNGGKSGT